jgi:hypothetical protein
MKCVYSLLIAFIVFSSVVNAQDEGDVVVKDRFARDKSIYVSFGGAKTLGDNLGDYKTGFSFEAGFLKKSNKLISWGGNLSYLGFKYDPDATYPYYYDVDEDVAIEAAMQGGDISLISLGFNLKLNFIPVGDHTFATVYGIVNPFVTYVSRKEVTASADYYWDEDGDGLYHDYLGSGVYLATDYPALQAENKVSGGAHLGLGVEFLPSKPVSFFLQATFSYTFPVSYVSSGSFLNDEDKYVDSENTVYYDADQSFYKKEYPIVEKGFSAFSLKFGVAFNF